MTQQTLEAGKLVGGRFEIIEMAGRGDLGNMYKARDTKVNRDIGIRIIPAKLIRNEEVLERVRTQVREASKLIHRNIRAVFGMGLEDDGSVYVATEWVDGVNLRTLLTHRSAQGKRFSFRGAYHIAGHVCNALSYAHGRMWHGTLSPRSVLVTRSGRVKVSDWEFTGIRRDPEIYPEHKRVESPFWSPDLMGGKPIDDPHPDIYSLGAIYYELITGQSPKRPLKAPSSLGFPPEVDQVIVRCMGGDPSGRFASTEELKQALKGLTSLAERSVKVSTEIDDDIGIDVEIDITQVGRVPGSSRPPGMMGASDLPPAPGITIASQGGSSGGSAIDMSEVLSRVGKSESAHWMVQKDKFDHGPFSDRELVQMIVESEVLGKHMLMDMDTGVRKKLRSWPQFEEVMELARDRKKQKEEAEALVRSDKAEKRSAMFFVVLVVSVIGVIGLAVTGFLLTREERQSKSYSKDGILAALDSGEIKIQSGSRKVKKGGKRRNKSGSGGKKSGKGEFVPGMSYEDAMNIAVDLGSLKNSGGQKQLTPGEISSIMDRNVRKFLPCVAGSGVKRVDMNVAINASGSVVGVSVQQGDAKLKKCVKSVVRRVKFPQSAAPRTAASWYFELM